MSSEYLNLYLYLQIWKSTCTRLKYFEKYLTPTLVISPLMPWRQEPLLVYSVETIKVYKVHVYDVDIMADYIWVMRT